MSYQEKNIIAELVSYILILGFYLLRIFQMISARKPDFEQPLPPMGHRDRSFHHSQYRRRDPHPYPFRYHLCHPDKIG